MIKQTQTKMFDFSDVDLDFCSGSKNKFPSVFKKMLSTGYNHKIANSVSISENQITLTYGGNHDYVADRVLLVSASGGFNKEVYIDTVTTNTVTCTVLDGITNGLTGAINSRIASLGYDLVYEVGNIHIYKFKALDESDLFLRLCFQNIAARRNCISACIGKSIDLNHGSITDSNALTENVSITSPGNGFKWEFTIPTGGQFDSYTYNQGEPYFGKAQVVGSPYHLMFLVNGYLDSSNSRINGFFPCQSFNYETISNYPVIIGERYKIDGDLVQGQADTLEMYQASQRVKMDVISNMGSIAYPQASSSFLPRSIDEFDTTTAAPISILTNTGQFLGFSRGGIYIIKFDGNQSATAQQSPSFTYDVDLDNKILIHKLSNNFRNQVFFAFPVEAINET
ncbi:hypothetical protein [Acinetobacter chinensis]|uniref:hypothetical protein n=1 Tax=Acinetobacter chinensis TaxID=2004650 RepID=UPI0029351BD0|nr:hypothetical protein [Acinetobacter chinensis]WOE40686.1 hypothetical protein QSG87_12435 [Acinetobacter chinensis]